MLAYAGWVVPRLSGLACWELTNAAGGKTKLRLAEELYVGFRSWFVVIQLR